MQICCHLIEVVNGESLFNLKQKSCSYLKVKIHSNRVIAEKTVVKCILLGTRKLSNQVSCKFAANLHLNKHHAVYFHSPYKIE